MASPFLDLTHEKQYQPLYGTREERDTLCWREATGSVAGQERTMATVLAGTHTTCPMIYTLFIPLSPRNSLLQQHSRRMDIEEEFEVVSIPEDNFEVVSIPVRFQGSSFDECLQGLIIEDHGLKALICSAFEKEEISERVHSSLKSLMQRDSTNISLASGRSGSSWAGGNFTVSGSIEVEKVNKDKKEYDLCSITLTTETTKKNGKPDQAPTYTLIECHVNSRGRVSSFRCLPTDMAGRRSLT